MNSKSAARFIIPAVALLVSIFIIPFSITFRHQYEDLAIANFQVTQRTQATNTAQDIENRIGNIRDQLEVMALSKSCVNPAADDCLTSLAAFYYSNPNIAYAGYRMDRRGILTKIFPTKPNDPELNADISSQEHVSELFTVKRTTISGDFQAVAGFPAIAVHAPIFVHGRFDGSVATIISIDKLIENYIKPLKNSRGQAGWLINEKGEILYHPLLDKEDNPTRRGAAQYKKRRLDSVRAGAPPLIDAANPREEAVRLVHELSLGRTGSGRFGNTLIAYSPVHMGHRYWSVIVAAPISTVTAPLKNLFYATWAYVAIFIAMLYFSVYWLFRSSIKAGQLEKEKTFLEEKVALQDELRRSLDHLDTIIKTMPSGLFTIDMNHTILTWNETAGKITGWSAGEVIGRNCSILGLDTCRNVCGLQSAELPKPVIGMQCRITTKDGRPITISKNVDYMRDAAGNIIGGIESFIDITEAKNVEEARFNAVALEKEVQQLRRMDEVKTNFLSMVSHELRTPLSVILGNITLALRGRFGAFEPALGSRLETIQKRANQLNLLIENLLNLSRLETGRLDIRKMPVYVEECVDDALAAMADEIRARNHLVEKKLSPDVPAAYADHDTFVQALTNIISNAVKFTPEGGHIEIISRPHKTHEFIELVVKDNGVGIPEKVLPHVFDRFYQADNTTTRSFGGTGIGLSIAKEIIDMHEGQIRIESTEGKGTEVIFSLPRPEVNGHRIQGTDLDARAPEAASLDDALAGPPRTLLLVDDDPDFLDMLCDTFQNTRFKILTAETAASAIELLRSEHPHLVLLDLMMNDMNGFEFIENVRTDTSLSNIPIIVVTASANDEHRARAISLGASDYLTKPLDSAELFKKISSVIG